MEAAPNQQRHRRQRPVAPDYRELLSHAFPDHQRSDHHAHLVALAIVGGVFALRGTNWSRWLLVVWAAYHVIISLGSPSSLAAHTVLLIVVAYVYFRGPAPAWFRARVDA